MADAEAASPAKRACMVAYAFYASDSRVRCYAETLSAHGYSVDVLALRPEGGSSKIDSVNGIRVFHLQRRSVNERSKFAMLSKLLLFFFRSMWLLTREHRKKSYDLIHIHSIPDFEVFAAWYPKLTGAKLILDIHDIVPEYYASKFRISHGSFIFKLLVAVERLSAGFADHVIVANHLWQRRLEERSVPARKLTTILNFPDTRIFRRRGRSRSDDKLIVLYPGSLNYHQGLDLAIRSFVSIMQRVPQAEFHIYGAGEQLSSLLKLIESLGARDRIFYQGARPLDAIPAIMENADLGIVPKRASGFGNEAFSTKILEFMAMGVPVLIPDTAIDAYYFSASVVRFFHAGDAASLAENMLDLLLHPRERERLTRNAGQFVENYLWSKHQGLYLNLVDSLRRPARRQSLNYNRPHR